MGRSIVKKTARLRTLLLEAGEEDARRLARLIYGTAGRRQEQRVRVLKFRILKRERAGALAGKGD
jgi:hypothetical protein